MRRRRTALAIAVVLGVTSAAAWAQQAGEALDLGARIAELRERAQRLTTLAELPQEARPEAEALLARYEELRLSEQELEVARLEALVAALEGGDSPAVAREVADSAVADQRIEVARLRESLQQDVEALVEQYPEAGGLLSRLAGGVEIERIVGADGSIAALRVRPGAAGQLFFHRPNGLPFGEGFELWQEPRPGIRVR